MKNTVAKLLAYLLDNFTSNFLGFIVAMASTRLVARFFTTRSIKNLWGLTAHKTVIDKQTYTSLEWFVSVIIGFVVFELISKGLKKRMTHWLPKYKASVIDWMQKRGWEIYRQNKEITVPESGV